MGLLFPGNMLQSEMNQSLEALVEERISTSAIQALEDQTSTSTPSWECQARSQQQQFLHFLGDRAYDSYRRKLPTICNLLLTEFCKCFESDDGLCVNDSEMTILKIKIGFALFGKPKLEPNSENQFTGYGGYNLKCILKIFDKIVTGQDYNRVLMAPVFVLLEGKGQSINQVAVFRIPSQKNKEDYWFVDNVGRLYKSWDGFLHNNKLPASNWCYPKNGVYSGNLEGDVEVCFGCTPPAKLSGKILNVADTASSIVGLGAGVGVFFPPVALASIVVGGAVGVYGIVRGSVELADRGKHGESLRDREALRHWLCVAGSSLGLGSAGGAVMVRWMAEGGKELSTLAAWTVNGISGSSLFVNGVGIAENLWTIIEQEKLSPLQCFQFVASVVFFAHSAVTIKTARSLYMETQNQIIEDHKAGLRSNRHRKLYDVIERETLKSEQDALVGRAKIIRDLNHMSNKNEFYARVLRSNKAAKKNSLPSEKVKFGELCTENAVQTSSQGVFTRFTAGNINQTCPSGNGSKFPLGQKLYYQEPGLLVNIRNALRNVANSTELNRLFAILDTVCNKFHYGKYFMRALRIVIDCYDCKNLCDARRIIEDVIQIVREIYEERVNFVKSDEGHLAMKFEEQTSKNQEEQEVQSSEEIMNKVVTDVDFIPNLLYSVEAGEAVYHFPTDHRQWGPNGELMPDDYVLIGANALGIANVECANIIHEGDTANVHFEHIGFVTVTSFVKEQKVVVKTISFHDSFE